MNIVMMSRILEITEKKSMFHRIKRMVSDWKAIVIVCVLLLTAKIAAEQLAMMVIRN